MGVAMADELEDTLDERLESIVRRAENFRELLRDGDEVTIAFADGEVHVEESYRSKFERKHAKVFGRMLSIEEQMKTGVFPYFLGLVFFGVFFLGLQFKWWQGVIDEEVRNILDNWWFYIAAPLAIVYLIHVAGRRWASHIYRRNRRELLGLIAVDKLDRDVLLVMLRDESDLDHVVYQLKLDTRPLPPLAA
jgi:hypothetical protein